MILGNNEEFFSSTDIDLKQMHSGTLAVTSAFLESFYPTLNKEETTSVEVDRCLSALSELLKVTIGIDDLQDWGKISSPILKGEYIFYQANVINWAVTKWLANRDITVSPRFLSIDECYNSLKSSENNTRDYEPAAMFSLQVQVAEAPPLPFFYKNGIYKVIKSSYLFNLIWNEIWHNLMTEKANVKLCPFCGVIYYPPPNNPNKSHCGKHSCKLQYLIRYHGGLEKYREWERNRKMPTSKPKRGRGRPSKKTEKGGSNQ